MVLLHRLAQSPDLHLHVVHVHHGLRAEADDDLKLVQETCATLKVAFQAAFVQVRKANSVQQQARVARYGAIGRICHELGCHHVVTAHHADDEAEANFVADAEGRARTTLPSRRDMEHWGFWIHRPLLAYTRADIQRWALAHHVVWREDASNHDLRYRRAQVRQLDITDTHAAPSTAYNPPNLHRLGADAIACHSHGPETLRQAARMLGGSISSVVLAQVEQALGRPHPTRIRSHGVDIWLESPVIVHRPNTSTPPFHHTEPQTFSFAGQKGPSARWTTVRNASHEFGHDVRDAIRKKKASPWYRQFGPVGFSVESGRRQYHLLTEALNGPGLNTASINALEF